MRAFVFALALSVTATAVAADVPPLRVPVDELVENIFCATDPSQSYTLYLPPGFTTDRRWPLLLVFDPRGRSVLATSLETALLIREDNAVDWYNLACARAQTNHPGAAVEALQRALEEGFDQTALLESDPDLDPLRNRDDLKAVVTAK